MDDMLVEISGIDDLNKMSRLCSKVNAIHVHFYVIGHPGSVFENQFASTKFNIYVLHLYLPLRKCFIHLTQFTLALCATKVCKIAPVWKSLFPCKNKSDKKFYSMAEIMVRPLSNYTMYSPPLT